MPMKKMKIISAFLRWYEFLDFWPWLLIFMHKHTRIDQTCSSSKYNLKVTSPSVSTDGVRWTRKWSSPWQQASCTGACSGRPEKPSSHLLLRAITNQQRRPMVTMNWFWQVICPVCLLMLPFPQKLAAENASDSAPGEKDDGLDKEWL